MKIQHTNGCGNQVEAKSERHVPQASKWEKNQTIPQNHQVNSIDVIDLDSWSRLKLSELQSRHLISRLGKLIFELPSSATVHRLQSTLHQHIQLIQQLATLHTAVFPKPKCCNKNSFEEEMQYFFFYQRENITHYSWQQTTIQRRFTLGVRKENKDEEL